MHAIALIYLKKKCILLRVILEIFVKTVLVLNYVFLKKEIKVQKFMRQRNKKILDNRARKILCALLSMEATSTARAVATAFVLFALAVIQLYILRV